MTNNKLPNLDIDVDILRSQRDALLTSIDDAEDFAQYGDSETRVHREKQVELLGGLIGMLDDILDHAEEVDLCRPNKKERS